MLSPVLSFPRLHPLARAGGLAIAALAAAAAGAPAWAQSASTAPAAPAAAPAAASTATTATGRSVQQVEVIGVSPLPGQEIDRSILPYTTTVLSRERLDGLGALNSAEALNRLAAGVQINDIQGSAFQGDLTFRGFRASPLLGAAQGVSVFLDGVRINEAFGDVVSFDLIPDFAVRSISLVPGANPAYGLNTLGGAMSYRLHDGRSAPGVRSEFSLGSHGRATVAASTGAADASGWHRYLAVSAFRERGWRDFSSGRTANALAKLGRSDGVNDWTASALVGQSRLIGNGLLPALTFDEDGSATADLYATRRSASYTHPDETRNRAGLLSLSFNRQMDAQSTLSALAYVRSSRRSTVNGDETDLDDEDLFDPAQPPGEFNTSQTRQTGQGVAVRYASRTGAHRWQVGLQLDTSRSRYEQFEQEGFLDATRGVRPGDEESELAARVSGSSRSLGLYASDTLALTPQSWLTGTVRFNHSTVRSDLLTIVEGEEGEPDTERLTGERLRFRSLNPALGWAHRLGGGATVFANAARNTRVPTVIELGCADPEFPCRLPTGLQADPPLAQVRSQSLEAGMRGAFGGAGRYSVAVYRTDNRDDILFLSAARRGFGYFVNVPRTRHQGLDAEWSQRRGAVELTAAYSLLRATYQSPVALQQGERTVDVQPGTPVAGLPRHTLKLSASWSAAPGWTLSADTTLMSHRSVAGNEDGRITVEDDEGDVDLQRRLRIPGHALWNLRAAWQASPRAEWSFAVTNLFDRKHESYGALAETIFDAQGARPYLQENAALFVAPGAPRQFRLALRYRFD